MIRTLGHLTQRGVVLLLVGASLAVTAWWLREPVLLWPGAFLVVLPLLALGCVWRLAPVLDVRRSLSPAEVSASHTLNVDLELRERSAASTGHVLVHDDLPASFGTGPALVLALQGRGSSSHRRYTCHPGRRGRFRLNSLRYRFSDPLGLAEREVLATEATEVVVMPRVLRLDERPQGAFTPTGETPIPHLAFSGPDDVLVREYRPGDDVRRIHWPSTARIGTLMVRREEQARDAVAAILLDSRAGVFGRDGEGEARFEWLVTLAASVGVRLLEQGFDLSLSDGRGPTFVSQARNGLSPRRDWLMHLVDAHPDEHASLTDAVRDLSGGPYGTLVVALLGRLTVEDARDLSAVRDGLNECWALFLDPPASGSGTAQERDLALQILVDHGWSTARLGVGADPGPVWSMLGTESGRGR